VWAAGANHRTVESGVAPRLDAILAVLHEQISEAEWTEPQEGFFVSGLLPKGPDIVEPRERAKGKGLKLSGGRGFFSNSADGNRFLRIPFCSLTE
jgi:2-aminoadipate transaminase